MSEGRQRVPVGQLVPGLFVDLELSWNQHPFLLSKFRIKSVEQIAVIQSLGLGDVLVDFERSAPGVLPASAPPESPPEATTEAKPEPPPSTAEALWQQKRASVDKAGQFRDRHADRLQHYSQSARATKQLMRELDAQPANAIRSADALVNDMAAVFSQDRNIIMNLVTLQGDDQDMYHHALNVMVLSMLLGQAAGFNQSQLRELAMGALLHDIGKIGVPARILMSSAPLTGAEHAVYQQHTRYGRDLARRVSDLPYAVLHIIHHHHELLDGSGYPDCLRGDEIEKPVRIVALTNLYDNLCNPPHIGDAIIPKAAMSVLYTRYKDKVDSELLALFIRTLGVYPPGTVVRLSDGNIGMVISVDPAQLLKPEVLLYHPDIPKEQAVIVDLRHEDLSIEAALTPGQYPPEVMDYLGVRARAGYYFAQRPR